MLFFDKKEGARRGLDRQAVGLRPPGRTALHAEAVADSAEGFSTSFIGGYKPGRSARTDADVECLFTEGRWRCYDYDELLKRDKLSLDLFWIRTSQPIPTRCHRDVLATEIADDLEAALAQL